MAEEQNDASDREKVLCVHPTATCLSLDVFGSTDYLIRAGETELTGWCHTEERAWALASSLVKRPMAE